MAAFINAFGQHQCVRAKLLTINSLVAQIVFIKVLSVDKYSSTL